MDDLHRQMETVLQIALVTGTFEAGEYERPNSYSPKGWRKVLEQRF